MGHSWLKAQKGEGGWKICRGQKYDSENKIRREQGGFRVRGKNWGVLVLERFILR